MDLSKGRIVPIIVIGIIIAAIGYWFSQSQKESTPYAFVNGRIIQITPEVDGKVSRIYVQENQPIKRGELMFELEQAPFNIAVVKAQAKLDELRNQKGRKTGSNEKVAAAVAALNQAQLNANRSKVYAPSTGIITNFKLNPGEIVHVKQPLFKIVTSSNLWVDAQFKETQISRIRKGQVAIIHLVSYPDHTFEGVVESVASTTTKAPSLEISNDPKWVAVKIRITNEDPKYPLRIGTSGKVNILINSQGNLPIQE